MRVVLADFSPEFSRGHHGGVEDLFWSEYHDRVQAHCHFWSHGTVDPRGDSGKYCQQLCMCCSTTQRIAQLWN